MLSKAQLKCRYTAAHIPSCSTLALLAPDKYTCLSFHKPSPSSPHTYLAIAGSRPPNPSLVIDLAKFGNDKGNQVTPEVLCCSLNEKLSQISLLQVQLAAVRWTAKGNLIITSSSTSSSQSLQAAALHISAIIPSLLPHLTNTSIPQPRANVKWSKILINGVPTSASKDRAPYC